MREKYGEWTVLGPSPDKKYYSRCQCSCGVIRDVANYALKSGRTKSCGHSKIENSRKTKHKKTNEKIIDKQFGRLVVIKRVGKESKFLCECSCGNMIEVPLRSLTSGNTQSCGCLHKEKITKNMNKIKEIGFKKMKESYVEGTSLYALKERVSKNSTTGVKGVSKMENGKYKAYISLSKIKKHLGTFNTLDEAKEARLQAEEELYKPILEKYKEEEK